MFKMNQKFLLFAFIATFFVGCKSDEVLESIPTDCTTIHWTYTGHAGTDEWVDLCTGNSACGGVNQSPVNLVGATENTSLTDISLMYETTTTKIKNNGHTIQFSCDPGSKINVNGTDYNLEQFHFHGQSEHLVAGAHRPLEIHFVHKATATDYAVIGLFIVEGAENPLLTDFLAHFPGTEGEYDDDASSIDLSSLLPSDMSYYNYGGSLTTPPCSEVVNWYVLQQTVTASAPQISALQSILNNNYRPVQALGSRTIGKHTMI